MIITRYIHVRYCVDRWCCVLELWCKQPRNISKVIVVCVDGKDGWRRIFHHFNFVWYEQQYDCVQWPCTTSAHTCKSVDYDHEYHFVKTIWCFIMCFPSLCVFDTDSIFCKILLLLTLTPLHYLSPSSICDNFKSCFSLSLLRLLLTFLCIHLSIGFTVPMVLL